MLGGRLSIQRSSINALIRRRLLRVVKATKWRMETVITEKGREALAAALADWADALTRARWTEQLLLPDVAGEIAKAEELGEAGELRLRKRPLQSA